MGIATVGGYCCSDLFDISFKTELSILKHPKSTSCKYNEAVSLSVLAIGTGQLKYRWRKDGQDIKDPKCIGVDTRSLGITSVSDAHIGKYTCIVEDSQTSVESKPAQLDLGKLK